MKSTIDFNEIAEHDDIQETMKVANNSSTYFSTQISTRILTKVQIVLANIYVQILVIFLMAAISNPDESKKVKYVQNLARLDEPSQFEIMKLVKQVSFSSRTD